MIPETSSCSPSDFPRLRLAISLQWPAELLSLVPGLISGDKLSLIEELLQGGPAARGALGGIALPLSVIATHGTRNTPNMRKLGASKVRYLRNQDL